MSSDFLQSLSRAFVAAGYRLYLVGGCVRDEMLGRLLHDLDLTTDAPPAVTLRLAKSLGANTYSLGEKFGTISMIADDTVIEVTTFRAANPGQFSRDLREDLAHRDFTINALARDLQSGTLHDYWGGADDLRAGIIRGVENPAARFAEDPARLVRAVRFAAQFGFQIEPATAAAIAAAAPTLRAISPERVGREISRLLVSDRSAMGVELLVNLGLAAVCLPELEVMRQMPQGDFRHKDVYNHTLLVLGKVAASPLLRWTALLHDIAKPQTYSVENGEVHFFGHEVVGARIAREMMGRLQSESTELVAQVSRLVELHLRAGLYEADWTDGAVRRFIREADAVLEPLLAFARADLTTANPRKLLAGEQKIDQLAERIANLQAQAEVARMHSPLDGDDLMALFSRPPGRWIAEIKDYLLNLVLDGSLNQEDRATATALALQFVAASEVGQPTERKSG